VPAVLEEAARDGKQVVAAILTHSHHDHVNGLPELLAARDLPVYLQRAELAFSDDLGEFKGALVAVGPGDEVKVGPLAITLIHTPGHTPGSQCLHCGGAVFTGDTLFVDHCGRGDLPGGDVHQLFHSLHRVLGALPGETSVYPGHDYGAVPVSSLARERAQNPYLVRTREEDFRAYRLR
jgi:glyoxylase-like metal-dependent hydrolase (beta-lactamase superfamily II)